MVQNSAGRWLLRIEYSIIRFMNRGMVIAAVVIAAIAGFKLLNKNPQLPNGKLTEDEKILGSLDISPQPITGKPQVEITTSKGSFVVELRPDVAPKTVTNFLTKWANGYCNGKIFHRVEDWVIQGCDPKGDGTGGTDSLITETSGENFAAGSVGVARKAFPKDISNDSQFFITKNDSPFLNNEYTYFGRVVSGMSVVSSIAPGDKIISTTILTK